MFSTLKIKKTEVCLARNIPSFGSVLISDLGGDGVK